MLAEFSRWTYLLSSVSVLSSTRGKSAKSGWVVSSNHCTWGSIILQVKLCLLPSQGALPYVTGSSQHYSETEETSTAAHTDRWGREARLLQQDRERSIQLEQQHTIGIKNRKRGFDLEQTRSTQHFDWTSRSTCFSFDSPLPIKQAGGPWVYASLLISKVTSFCRKRSWGLDVPVPHFWAGTEILLAFSPCYKTENSLTLLQFGPLLM